MQIRRALRSVRECSIMQIAELGHGGPHGPFLRVRFLDGSKVYLMLSPGGQERLIGRLPQLNPAVRISRLLRWSR
jgi:hypothetical protein